MSALWAFFLILQNFSFVLVSRGRNSKSIIYHGIASFFSNSIWFFQSLFLLDNSMKVLKDGTIREAINLGIFYTFFTMTGALASHYVALKLEERKKIEF